VGLRAGPAKFRHDVFQSLLRLIKKNHDGALAGRHARKLAPNS